jgi:hypothetical protein
MDDRDQGLTTADIADSSRTMETDGQDGPDLTGANGEIATGRLREDDRLAGAADSGQLGDAAGGVNGSASDAPLLAPAESKKFSEDWRAVQGDFVDRPREAVEQADRLVADLMQRLASEFSQTRANLERQWDGQDDISTEELRVAMTRYRSFFERLLSA